MWVRDGLYLHWSLAAQLSSRARWSSGTWQSLAGYAAELQGEAQVFKAEGIVEGALSCPDTGRTAHTLQVYEILWFLLTAAARSRPLLHAQTSS